MLREYKLKSSQNVIPQNVVTLSVNDVFAQPGIGVPGVSSTDTNHGLFIGGHPKPGRQVVQVDTYFPRMVLIRNLFCRLEALDTNGVPFVGCIKDIVIERQVLNIEQSMLRGDVHSHVCPTI